MIEIEKLTKRYGKSKAVSNLNLTIPKGELFCLLGPNGAGKTTTIKIITGLLKPTSGSVKVMGINMADDPVKAKNVLGYIPDMPFLYRTLTPVEFLQFTGDVYGTNPEIVKKETDSLLEMFGLSQHRDTLIKNFSHGMKQRLIYSATFLHNPEILLIDEPLIGIDPATIRLIKDLLKLKAESGTTILLTTHILALAQDIADRIGIIHGGSLITTGTVPDLLKQNNSQSLEELFLSLTESKK